MLRFLHHLKETFLTANTNLKPGQRLSGDTPSPIDVHVGGRLRLRRTLLGLSQEKMGAAVGVTFQQIQKYERGVNRVVASRLFRFAEALDVPVGFFFEGYEEENREGQPADPLDRNASEDLLYKGETLSLIRNYYGIKDDTLRQGIFDLVEMLNQRK